MLYCVTEYTILYKHREQAVQILSDMRLKALYGNLVLLVTDSPWAYQRSMYILHESDNILKQLHIMYLCILKSVHFDYTV